MKELEDLTKIVMKSKKYQRKLIENMKIKLAEYNIVETVDDFNMFMMRWFPTRIFQRVSMINGEITREIIGHL